MHGINNNKKKFSNGLIRLHLPVICHQCRLALRDDQSTEAPVEESAGAIRTDSDIFFGLWRTIERNRHLLVETTTAGILDYKHVLRLHSGNDWCRGFDDSIRHNDPPHVGAIHG